MTDDLHPYRTHTCQELRLDDVGETVRLSGWIHRKRDHGNLVFVDLRDHYGLTQCVIDISSPLFEVVEKARPESVLTVTGAVVSRSDETINRNLATGEVELAIAEIVVCAGPTEPCSSTAASTIRWRVSSTSSRRFRIW